MKFGIYIRVSTEEQKHNFSPDFQLDLCIAQVRVQGGQGYDVYQDLGLSGKESDRPGYQKMISDLHAGHIQGVIVYKLDRLSRDAADLITLVKLFKMKKWVLFSAMEVVDITTPTGTFLVQMLAVLAEYERSMIKGRMVGGFAQKQKSGGKVGGDESSVFGYTRDEHGQLCIDEAEAHIIRDVFRLRAEGLSTRAISDALKDRGVKNRLGGTGFSHTQVSRQLKNENIYRGVGTFKGGGDLKFPRILDDEKK